MKKAKTKAERRLAVLKDAVKQLQLNNYYADPGTVVYIQDRSLKDSDGALLSIPAKEALEKALKGKNEEVVCHVCARGALLVSTVHKENDFVLSDFEKCGGSFMEGSTTDTRLAELFSPTQLALMEQAFEEGMEALQYEQWEIETDEYTTKTEVAEAMNYEYLSKNQILAACKFHDKYDDPTKRLIAIFKNAIKNNGIFKP